MGIWRYQDYHKIMALCEKYNLHQLPRKHTADATFVDKEMVAECIKIKLRYIDVGKGDPQYQAYREASWERERSKYEDGKIDWYEIWTSQDGISKVYKDGGLCIIHGSLVDNKRCVGPWFDDKIIAVGREENGEEEEWYLQRDDQDEKLFVGSYRILKVPPDPMPTVDYIFDCKLHLK